MMAGYRFNKEEYFKETKEVYSNYPTDVSRMEEELDRLQKENPKASSFQKKTWIYRIASQTGLCTSASTSGTGHCTY